MGGIPAHGTGWDLRFSNPKKAGVGVKEVREDEGMDFPMRKGWEI